MGDPGRRVGGVGCTPVGRAYNRAQVDFEEG
jgi:hypothetical protein